MVRVGLVAYVEEQLERDISLGRLSRSGQLGSERVLARIYGVSRGTVREALRRLAARGLVVQRSGRQARAVALDESLTLENLGLALHDERSEECRRLLEGFFSLKRQVLVELLADCCARASQSALEQLESACFRLWDAARWHPGARCAEVEFELLRLAAQVAERPGHLLLIQSLQRALRGNASRLLSFMGGESLRQWAVCAMGALGERDARALQDQLPALLKACDERVLDDFAPTSHEPAASEAPCAQDILCAPTSATGQDVELETRPGVEEQGLVRLVPTAEDTAPLGIAPCPHAEPLPIGPAGEHAEGDGLAEALGDLPDCRTGGGASSPEEDPRPEAPPTSPRGQTRVTAHQEGGPLRGTQGPLGRWAARLWRIIVRSLGPPPLRQWRQPFAPCRP
ncbi:FadR family transcriptional regulator [Corallococcus exercitus]|uniref:FadR family transcriptional regulator n=1 Tax=Corallococcus exercitus TaxID=2316736 RepID=A0A7Y4JXS5_9BACT|nr:GntR family transcriptional regulator [Corallococcus exercitus]NOK13049.1 FadR family transcriptional regulator [Corallococcus exercitus]